MPPPYPANTLPAYQYAHANGAGTTVIVSSSTQAVLHSVTINTGAAAGTVTLFDNGAGSGKVVAVITTTAVAGPTLVYDVALTAGLTAVITGAVDITVAYSG